MIIVNTEKMIADYEAIKAQYETEVATKIDAIQQIATIANFTEIEFDAVKDVIEKQTATKYADKIALYETYFTIVEETVTVEPVESTPEESVIERLCDEGQAIYNVTETNSVINTEVPNEQ